MNQDRQGTTISQTVDGVAGQLYHLEFYFNLQGAINGREFSCMFTPSINSQQLPSAQTLTDSGPYGFKYYQTYFSVQSDGPATLAITAQCDGSYNQVILGLDDVALTKVCAQ